VKQPDGVWEHSLHETVNPLPLHALTTYLYTLCTTNNCYLCILYLCIERGNVYKHLFSIY